MTTTTNMNLSTILESAHKRIETVSDKVAESIRNNLKVKMIEADKKAFRNTDPESKENEELFSDLQLYRSGLYFVMIAANEVKYISVNGNEYYYATIYNPYIVMSNGASVAVNAGSVHEFGKDITFIIGDQHFFDMSEDMQTAIAAHEIGHTLYKTNKGLRNKKNEVEADQFAERVVGKETMVKLLNTLKHPTYKANRLQMMVNMNEINYRIAHL